MADGTAPTTGNLIENFFFRVDTADTEGTIDANFNIQLNLGGRGGRYGRPPDTGPAGQDGVV